MKREFGIYHIGENVRTHELDDVLEYSNVEVEESQGDGLKCTNPRSQYTEDVGWSGKQLLLRGGSFVHFVSVGAMPFL